MTPNDHLLRMALRANATFSTACAITSLVGGAGLANALAIPDPAFLPVLAVNLLVFAGFLVWLSTRPAIPPALGWAVVVADALWVVGTIPIVAGDVLNATGDTVALIVAGFVALWAVLQVAGIRRLSGQTAQA